MRRTGSWLLATAWHLLAVVYSTPLWLQRFLKIDVVVMAEPGALQRVLPVLVVVAAALPPSLLAALTWWWARRRRTA